MSKQAPEAVPSDVCLTDEQYRARFIDRLSMRFREEEHMRADIAQQEAEHEYRKCPRAEMMEEFRNDPENCADETWLEWCSEYESEGEDDEWDGDEDEDEEEEAFDP